MRLRLFRFVLGLLLLGLAAGVGIIYSPQGKQYLAQRGIEIDKAERRLRHRFGIPLRGTPDLAKLKKRLDARGMKLGDPIFIRIFKQESELELWIKRGDRFEHFATYPICRWSGLLGPKLKQGDKQAPEGFYTVSKGQLNPNSRWHRSFNLGYPNLHDRAHGRTGDYLMVHGGCSSIGCYAMTNPVVTELWQLVTKALNKSQSRFAVHAFPFRMEEHKLKTYATHKWAPFWKDLKAGYDLFEEHRLPPIVSVCNGRYQFRKAKPRQFSAPRLKKKCTSKTVSTL